MLIYMMNLQMLLKNSATTNSAASYQQNLNLTCMQCMASPGPVNNLLWHTWHLKCLAFWCCNKIFSSSNSLLQYLHTVKAANILNMLFTENLCERTGKSLLLILKIEFLLPFFNHKTTDGLEKFKSKYIHCAEESTTWLSDTNVIFTHLMFSEDSVALAVSHTQVSLSCVTAQTKHTNTNKTNHSGGHCIYTCHMSN